MAEQIVEKPQDTDDKPTAPGPNGLWEGMNRATDTILASMVGAGTTGARTAADYFMEDGSGRLKPQYHDGTKGPGAIGWNRHAVQFVARNQVERVMAAVGTWESGGGVVGKIDFGAVGPTCRNGDHAYGAWQVMGRNINSWGQEAGLGHVTLAQFMEKGADGQITARAQQLQHDIVFHQFEKHLKAGYAPEDAASIWFTGSPRRPGFNPNDGGTDANTYVSKFSRAYAQISVDPNAPSAVATAKPDSQYVAATAATPWKGQFDLAIGDSLAAMAINAGVYGTTGSSPAATGAMAAVSRKPEHVLAFIDAALAKDPNAVKGQSIVLSSGAANDYSPAQMALVTQEINKLKAAGATVTLLGVGDRHDYQANNVNGQLLQIATNTGVAFAGEIPGLGADRVHPSGRRAEETMVRNAELAANKTYGASGGSSTMAFLGRLKSMVVGEAHAEPVQTADAAPAARRTFDKGALTTADASPAAHKPAITPGKTPAAAPTVTT